MLMKVKRKRGGQPGNQNARTHGRYSRVTTPEEAEVVRAVSRLDEHGKRVVLGYLVEELLPELAATTDSLR
jgi:hypothetical protein